ncbi:MAG TPA: glycosyltransferase, partial [Candidatus Dormibacteraeota bacterium]|nr:glycosyltransferase [Candidatus Dormibacteraeota bacterium]
RALGAALARQRIEGGRLGEILIAYGYARETDVWKTLAKQWDVRLTQSVPHWIDPEVAHAVSPATALVYRILPMRVRGGVAVVAMANPNDVAARRAAEEAFKGRVLAVFVTPAALRRRQEEIYRPALIAESTTGLQDRRPEASAFNTLSREQRVALGAVGVLSLVGLILLGGAFFILLASGVVLLYAAVVGFRCWVTYRGGRYEAAEIVTHGQAQSLTELPVITILCPLYREAGVLPQLLRACARLDYPKTRLDVKLLLEADDAETLDVVHAYRLPGYVDVIVVPAEGQRTKPKACNYGLQFARGDYTVIFDAEDIPEPDQLRKAVTVFRRGSSDVGCVQAKLNYYNSGQNVLTGWFALEYTAWFDFFLPGLVERRFPVPLGGSSNYFPTRLLNQIGAWDPNNVTEDADLGMRIHRAGCRVVMMDSTTWEEANSDFVNWMKQRSRWGKGYLVTWLVQMRHPVRLLKELGWRSFCAVQLTLGGTYAISLLNLLVWTLTALWILARFNFIAYLFPSAIYYIGMIELIFGNFLFVYLGLWSAVHRRSYNLGRVALLVPFYWLMISLAMVKATLQLFTAPTFWEKTVHGLYTAPARRELTLRETPAGP